MRVGLLIVTASIVSAVASYWPAQAHACSCAGGFVTSSPANAESGWPRNQALQLRGNIQPETISLQKLDGATHAFTLRQYRETGPCASGFVVELTPTPALDPDTQYVMSASSIVGQPGSPSGQTTMIRFSTGSELLPDPELRTPTRAEVALSAPPSNSSTSCGPLAAHGCLIVDEATDVEVVMRKGDAIINELLLMQANTPLLLWEMPTCIDVQRRAKTGRRSAPLSLCGDALTLLPPQALNCPGDIFGSQARVQAAAGVPPSTTGSGGAGSTTNAQSAAPMIANPQAHAQPMAANSEPQHRVYGCSAVPHSDRSSAPGWLACLVLLALWRWFVAQRNESV